MRPFELDKDEGDNQREGSAVEGDEGNGEAISMEEEEGAMVKIGKAERAASMEEVVWSSIPHLDLGVVIA